MLGFLAPEAVAKFEELQPFHKPRGNHGKIQHPLLLMKELADADKHRVLPTTYGSVDLAKASVEWDSSATQPTFRHLLSNTERHLRDGTAIARVRFARGNATATSACRSSPGRSRVRE